MSDRTTSPPTSTSQTAQSSMTMKGTGGSTMAIPHEKIATLAYEKWCQRGCKHGTNLQDWLDAEAELKLQMMGGKGMQPGMQQPASRPAQATAAAMPQKSAPRR